MREEILYSLNYLITYYVPIVFEEQRGEAVWSWAFIGAHRHQCCPNFQRIWDCTQQIIIRPGDKGGGNKLWKFQLSSRLLAVNN